jgi:hypothetical protein
VLTITIADDSSFQLSWGPTIVHSGLLPGVYVVAYIGSCLSSSFASYTFVIYTFKKKEKNYMY